MSCETPPCGGGRAPGLLIAVEGIDGTGKSTLVQALAAALRARGRNVVASFEPTRGPWGSRVRALASGGRESVTPEQELAWFTEDRREHVRDVIRPALERGDVVLLDRYFYSTMAYQGARGLDPAAIERENLAFAPLPDLLVLLELPVAQALQRITRQRGAAPDAFEGAAYLERVAAIFRDVGHPNLLPLDASRPTEAMVASILDRLSLQ